MHLLLDFSSNGERNHYRRGERRVDLIIDIWVGLFLPDKVRSRMSVAKREGVSSGFILELSILLDGSYISLTFDLCHFCFPSV